MNINSLLGQQLQSIEVLDFSSPSEPKMWRDQILCGAVALDFDRSMIVIRSPLRYKWPACRLSEASDMTRAPMLATCTDRETAFFIKGSLTGMGFSRPCNDRGNWQSLSPASNGKVTGTALKSDSLSLKFESGADLYVRYQVPLDGSIVVSRHLDLPGALESIDIKSAGSLFGWLRPDSGYRVLWSGRRWPSAHAAWSLVARRESAKEKKSIFMDVYSERLAQHPVLLRRFRNINVPVRWSVDPEVGEWINELCRSN